MGMDKGIDEMMDELEKTIDRLDEEKLVGERVISNVKAAVKTVRTKVANLKQIETATDAFRQEILEPVAAQLKAGAHYSRRGFRVGLVSICISIIAMVWSTVLSFNADRVLSTLESTTSVIDSILVSSHHDNELMLQTLRATVSIDSAMASIAHSIRSVEDRQGIVPPTDRSAIRIDTADIDKVGPKEKR